MTAKRYEVYVQKGRPWYKILSGIVFSHLGLFVLCIVYAIIGALILIKIEHPYDQNAKNLKMSKSKDVDAAVEYLKMMFWLYANDEQRFNYTQQQFSNTVLEDLETLKTFVVEYNSLYKYDMTENWNYDWIFPNALLYTMSLITTIGYGNIYVHTDAGKLFTIGFSLIGIPLLLVFMKDIGDVMAVGVRWSYSRLCCRWCRVRRRDAELPPNFDRRTRSIMHDDVGKETYMPTDFVAVPIVISLIIMFLFIFIGALVFDAWEGWELTASIYFCFVTLSTIGFGDLLPNHSFQQASVNFAGVLKMCFTIIYMVFGIMLISLALNLMQEQVLNKVQWVAQEIGMNVQGGDNGNEELVKVTKEERLKQTPADMTGNELDFNEKRSKKEEEEDNNQHEEEQMVVEDHYQELYTVTEDQEENRMQQDNCHRTGICGRDNRSR